MKSRISVFLILLYTLVFNVGKTLRFPNDWAESHWLMDYRFGFIKRGLAGEIFGWLFPKTELSITILSAIILFALYFLFLLISGKEIFKKEFEVKKILFYLLFFSSQYIVFSAHLIGYLDHLVLLFTILTVFLIRKKQIFIASLVAAFSVLIHEISFLILMPISVFTLIISQISSEGFSLKLVVKKENVFQTLQFFSLPLFALLSIFLLHDGESLQHAKVFNYLKQNSFIEENPADSVASGFTKSFSYQWEAQSPHFFQRVFVSTCAIFYGIPMLAMTLFIFNFFDFKKNLYLFLLLIAVCFCPLLLHAIAYDTYRIWTFPFVMLFLIFWILQIYQLPKNEKSPLNIFELFLFTISIIFTLFIPNHLFDGEVERFSFQIRVLCSLALVFGFVFILKKSNITTF